MGGKRRFESLLTLSKDRRGTRSTVIEFLEMKKGEQLNIKELKDALNLPVNVTSPDLFELLNKMFPGAHFTSNSQGTKCRKFSFNRESISELNPKPEMEEEQEPKQDLRKIYGLESSSNEPIDMDLDDDAAEFFVDLTRKICEKREEKGIYLEDLWSELDRYKIRRGFSIVRALVESGLFEVKDRVKSVNDIRRPYVQLLTEKLEKNIEKKPEHLFLVPSSINLQTKETVISNLGDKRIVNFDPKELTKSEVLEVLKFIYMEKAQILTSDEDKKIKTLTLFENILKED